MVSYPMMVNEWTDDMLIKDVNETSLYMRADEEYLYVMAPVCQMSLSNLYIISKYT